MTKRIVGALVGVLAISFIGPATSIAVVVETPKPKVRPIAYAKAVSTGNPYLRVADGIAAIESWADREAAKTGDSYSLSGCSRASRSTVACQIHWMLITGPWEELETRIVAQAKSRYCITVTEPVFWYGAGGWRCVSG